MTQSLSDSSNHQWRFFRTGGLDQVHLDTAADLTNLEHLDQKLWVALSCPVRGLEFDEKTLALIDTDKDNRVRVPEVLAAVKWASAALNDPGDLITGGDTIALSSIKDAAILASAKQILANIGKPEATSISLAESSDTAKIFANTRYNGDGVITPESMDTETQKQLIGEILATQGGVADRSGGMGVDTAKLEAFYADAAAYSAWQKAAEDNAATILPIGAGTAAGLAALNAVRTKVDDYFARCRVTAYDSRASAAVNRAETDYTALAQKDISASAVELAGFPLSHIAAGQALPLKDRVNPAWSSALASFVDSVVTPLLGKDKTTLTEAEWVHITTTLAPYSAWLGAKAGASVEKLGLARVRALLAGNEKAAILAVIAHDKSLEPQIAAISAVEKLIRYKRDLHLLLNNFVSFSEFYHPEHWSVFQVGVLYLDGRACELCVRVDDAGKHAALAGLAKTYLVYCDCSRLATGEKMTIAAALTNGDSDNIMVGRNGIFYDRKGRDWDATITKIVENPISIREAFWSPYKKLIRFIEEQVAKRAAAADSAATDKLQISAATVATADKAKAPEPKKFDLALITGIGVALGSIGGFLAGIMTGFISLGPWMPLGILGLMLAISGPSMIIAALKLRQRNLGPILDANGWAINGRVRITIPFGAKLTDIAELPHNSVRSLTDPYADKKIPWKLYLILIALLCVGAYTVHFWVNKDRWWWQSPAPAAVSAKKLEG
ncbi:MAG: hypothetical protein SFY80_12490 [Verrucomicrobiota bacterium]|nr:hypothetical protein [Verrucomicrobiota bacterium]